MPPACSLQPIYNTIREKFLLLNLFKSRSTDPTTVRRELLSTRLLILLLGVSTLILTLYTSISAQSKTETIKWPTESVYEDLRKNYPHTLQCPCANISIAYGKFANIVPSFHQVCESPFVSQRWIDFAFQTNTTFIWPMDIRTSLSAMWQLISLLCQSATETIKDAMARFSNSTIISSLLLTTELLEAKMRAALDLARQAASSAWVKPLTTVHLITQANGFMTGLLTNYVGAQAGRLVDETHYVWTLANKYKFNGTNETCSCQTNGSCPMIAGFYLYSMTEKYGKYDLNQIQANSTLSGIVIDCLPLQTISASSLECFYKESCMNTLFSAYSIIPVNHSILDTSSASRFVPTTNLSVLIDELFIEDILNETVYKSYYLECTPTYCTFSYSRRFDSIYVVTTLIALLGGLHTTLHLIVPHLIDLIFFVKKRRSHQIVEPQLNENKSMKIRVKDFLAKTKMSILKLNLFEKHSNEPTRLRRGFIATRLYLIMLIGMISVLIVYISISGQTIHTIVQAPSVEQYEELREHYSDTLQCPCTVVSILYHEFIAVTPTFHQLCSSDFVQPWWYESLPAYFDLDSFLLSSASSHFRTLAMLCEIANWTIVDASRRFSSTVFVNAQVMTRDSFKAETDAFIRIFLNSTQADFLHTMSLIQAVIQANQYVSAMSTNTLLAERNFSDFGLVGLDAIKVIATSISATEDNDHLCYCVRNGSCSLTSIYDEYFLTIDGVRSAGCFVVNMVLQSTLQCWYDISCMNTVRALFDDLRMSIPTNVSLLDPLLPSRFTPNTSITTIVNEIMVEQWNSSTSYENFYQKCDPVYCTYSYQKRSDPLYIITTIIGLFGGLNVILRLLCPLFVRIFLQFIMKMKLNNSTQRSTNREPADDNNRNEGGSSNIRTRLRHNFATFNLFDSGSSQNEILQRELISTRLYVLVLLVSMLIIIVYTALSSEIVSQIVSTPSQAQYEELMKSDFITIQCPCAQISVAYKQITTIETLFHQVCSSDFVQDIWLDYLFGDSLWYKYHPSDLRVRGTAYFTFLSTLCTLSQTTIDNAARQFLTEEFVSVQMMPESVFISKMTAITKQFQTTTSARFSHELRLLRSVTHASTFVSSYFSNWYWWVKPNRTSMTLPTNAVTMNDGCSCATRSDCMESGGIDRSFSDIQYFEMPGWHIGCSPVETLLRSTFECLYNQTCIDTLVHYASTIEEFFFDTIHVSAMNSTLPSRFKTDSVIEEIVEALFVEQWQINMTYSSFYNQCAPMHCTYTFKKRNNPVYKISEMLGLYGGLSMSLRFIVPYLIALAFKTRDYCRRNAVIPLA